MVQAGDRLTDNQWNLDITKKHEELFVGVVGNMPNIGTPEFRPMLIRLAKDPRYLGFRISGRPKNRKLFSGSIWEDLQLTSNLGLTLDLLMNNHTANIGFDEVETIAKKYPDLNIVMNHVGGYPIDGENIEPNWSKRFEEIARNENVFCKVSALLERSVIRPYSFEPTDYRSVLDFLLAIFGEDRLIYGSDWPSHDGTGIRDFIHVMDLAEAHLSSLKYIDNSNPDIFTLNIGTGKGTTVLELIRIFERVNKCIIPIEFTKRRKGDVPFSVANISLALKVLDWSPNRSIEEACLDGWRWQLNKQ